MVWKVIIMIRVYSLFFRRFEGKKVEEGKFCRIDYVIERLGDFEFMVKMNIVRG